MRAGATHQANEPGFTLRRGAGFTLVELLVAMGLLSILVVALLRLIDTSLALWSEGESRRDVVSQASATAGLLARDLRTLHPGRRGDVLAEWVLFDTDGDGIREKAWPRLRLVHEVSPAQISRLRARARAAETPAGADVEPEAPLSIPPPSTGGLVEVVWVVRPMPGGQGDGRAEGLLLRGERLLDEDVGESLFAAGFFDSEERPPLARVDEVTGGILWFGMQFATQASIVHDGWRIGFELGDAGASWDAWSHGRPDPDLHPWNEAAAGVPARGDLAALPRRVRLELEFERARDRQRRARLVGELDPEVTRFEVTRGSLLPAVGQHVLIGAEWMEVLEVAGDQLHVRRGRRATAPLSHDAGEMIHHGTAVAVEVPVAAFREDWKL
jgi:prepilin-type N-terminal cleavage/methylation domain-containing protein